MGEEKDIASMKNKKGYWNEKYCDISESTKSWKVCEPLFSLTVI